MPANYVDGSRTMEKLFDLKTEQSLLLTAIINRDNYLKIVEEEEEIFYENKNKLLLRALKNLYSSNVEVDIPTLRSWFITNNLFEKFGGDEQFLKYYASETTLNFDVLLCEIKNYYHRRKLNDLSLNIRDFNKQFIGVDEILDHVNENIKNIGMIEKRFVSINKVLDCTVEDLYKNNEYYETGIEDLDAAIKGFFCGQLIMLGARTRFGKSLLALQIAKHVAKTKRVLFISLEMSKNQIAHRYVSMGTGVSVGKIRSGNLDFEEFAIIKDFLMKCREIEHNLILYEGNFNLGTILRNIRKFDDEGNVGLVVVDYLQLINVGTKEQRHLQVAEISRGLKMLALELNIPILALSQLNRMADGQTPKLSDLRESGSLEQDSDIVLFLHRPDSLCDLTELIIAKNRDEAEKIIQLRFVGRAMTFQKI